MSVATSTSSDNVLEDVLVGRRFGPQIPEPDPRRGTED
jgi:hypothetical protein